jgi:uncharacterized membrane protein
MTGRPPRFLLPTVATRAATLCSFLAILCTATWLAWSYASLPDILPVRFRWDGRPIGWQFRTWPRVLMPVFVQIGLLSTLGAISALLLYRPGGGAPGARGPAQAAACQAAEAVMLMTASWVGFQAYAAFALLRLWSGGRSTLGVGYTLLEGACLTATIAIGLRARTRLGRPEPLPYVATDWRLGQLYCNGGDPALFVPTRDGRRWTLNFGRPAAVLLLGGALVAGIVLPTLILALALR